MAIRLGAIGAGNMATAVLCGAVASSVLKSGNAGVFDIADAAALALADKCGAKVFPSAGALVEWADVILLASGSDREEGWFLLTEVQRITEK